MIYTVVCTDINDYANWQFELLEYTWSRINQPGELVRLVACNKDDELPVHRHAQVHRTEYTNVHPISGDHYACYNRLYSLQQWLNECDIEGTILMVDCDVVFRNAINLQVQKGKPLAQHWIDYACVGEFRDAMQLISQVDLDDLQAATWPALIDADDLRDILPRWLEATVEIREKTKRQESDMFGFLIAAKEQNLTFDLGTTTAFMPWPDERVKGAPIIHYCQQVKDLDDNVIWGKWGYSPWDRIDFASKSKLAYCTDLLALIDEFARVRNFEREHQNDTIFIAIASYCEPELIDTIDSCLNKARNPEKIRFGICHQFDDGDPATSSTCLDRYSQDLRFRYVIYDYKNSEGGCWARNIAQQLYDGETYTLQIDAHTQMVESWDTLLIEMMHSLPSKKPLISQFPPLYSIIEGEKQFCHLNDFTQVNTVLADHWTANGWLYHPQKIVEENNRFPRYTRALSGAFVFTSGEWNEVVRQDPQHFYHGEEFAIAVRSFTHGYDLFDPNQIVCWHRNHGEPNRKFWDDNAKSKTATKHSQAFERIQLLFDDQNHSQLGRYGLGRERTLNDYARFSGIDCVNKTISDDAKKGVWSNEVGFLNNFEQVIDVTVNLHEREPLLLGCTERTPVLLTLFFALKNQRSFPNEVVYLELGENGEEKVFFKASQLVSIETNPELSAQFFVDLQRSQTDITQTNDVHNPQSHVVPFNDEWKLWIWSNFGKGVHKDELFKRLLQHGFDWASISHELNYVPSFTQQEHQAAAMETRLDKPYVASSVAQKLDTKKLDIYTIDDFLNRDECEALIEVVSKNLQRSTVVGNDTEDDRVITEARTSQSCHFVEDNPAHELAFEIRRRISRLVGININYAEPIQAQAYSVGGEYKAHYDWFDPATEGFKTHASVEKGGQRSWSVVVYLNDVIAGGETNFENVDISISPKQGKLVFWSNLDENGFVNYDALHQACPVLEGEKVILTLWFRSLGDGEIFQREPRELLPRFTQSGFHKSCLSKRLFKQLSDFYTQTALSDRNDEFVEGEFIVNAREAVGSRLISIPEALRKKIISELQPVCEEWSNEKLRFTALYGIREYLRNTELRMHIDLQKTHIISVIINLAQQADKAWPLELIDHVERRHSIYLNPGEILLYEGARLEHGRPTPFQGDCYANIFLHFCPIELEAVSS